MAWMLLAAAPASRAAELFNEDDVAIRWDNTVRYSAQFRLAGRDPALLGEINGDDGDRAFAPGLVSDRVDLLSQLDIAADGFGLDASAAAWYDTVYNQRSDNHSPATFNPVSVPHDAFPKATRDLQGRQVELVDAFVYGKTELGGMPFSFRLGRYTLLWGESLYFADNGIAGAQAPRDDVRAAGDPGYYAKKAFLPLAQASASLQLRDDMAIEAYYQFEWRPARLPGVGSYFSADDYVDAGGERYIVAPGRYFYRGADQSAPANGQFGVAFRFNAETADFALYALRYNAKDAQIYYRPGTDRGYGYGPYVIDPAIVDYSIGKIGEYFNVYPRGIELYGASASFTLGDSTVGAEISARRNAPLPSRYLTVMPGQAADAGDHALYAIGDMLNADLSSITNFARTKLWDSAVLSMDLAANWRIGVSRNGGALDTGPNRLAAAFQVSFEPTYFEVLPHLDLTPLLSVEYDFVGNLSPDPYRSQSEGAGQVQLGLTAKYRVVWSGTIAVTRYIGAPHSQPLADRDYLSLSIQRTF